MQWVQQTPRPAPPARAYASLWPTTRPTASWCCSGVRRASRPPPRSSDTWLFYSAPNPPTRVTAVAGNGQATVTFDGQPFYGDGGYTITSYTATPSSSSQNCTVTPSGIDQTPTAYSCVVVD